MLLETALIASEHLHVVMESKVDLPSFQNGTAFGMEPLNQWRGEQAREEGLY